MVTNSSTWLNWTDSLETEVNNHAASIDRAYEKLLSLEIYSRDRDFNLRLYNIPERPGENCMITNFVI